MRTARRWGLRIFRGIVITALSRALCSCGDNGGAAGADNTALHEAVISILEDQVSVPVRVELLSPIPEDEEAFVVLRGIHDHGQDGDAEREETKAPPEFDRVALGKSRVFTMSMPPGLRWAWIELDSHFLTADPVYIGRPDPENPTLLKVSVGGVIEVALVPEPGLEADPSVLLGEQLGMSYIPDGDFSLLEFPSVSASIGKSLIATFTGQGTDREFSVGLQRPPFALVLAYEIRAHPLEVHRVELSLRDGWSIYGVVTDEAGVPIPWATVKAAWFLELSQGREIEICVDAQTDMAGRYRVECAIPEFELIQVDARGYRPASFSRGILRAEAKRQILLNVVLLAEQ